MDPDLLLLQRSRDSAQIESANKIVERFISERGLIVYGGTAIDYALRLLGHKIYEDDLLPFSDYDFYSPNNAKDSYDLANILFEEGYRAPMSAGALYIRTMRVGFDSNIIADITYVPKSLFDKIKYVKVTLDSNVEIKIVALYYQIIDMHIALSYPYTNPPTEAIFHRTEKDVKRYNLIYEYYLKEFLLDKTSRKKCKQFEVTIPTIILDNITTHKGLCHGILAFAVIQQYCIEKFKYKHKYVSALWDRESNKLILDFTPDGKIPLCCFVDRDDLEWTNNALLELFPISRQELFNDVTATLYKAEVKQYPIIEHDGLNIATLQQVLFYFAVKANLFSNESLELVYWSYYTESLEMLNFLFAQKPDHFTKVAEFGTTVWPSTETLNISESIEFWMKVTEESINDKINKTETVKSLFDKKPKAYYPAYAGSEELYKEISKYNYDSPYFTVDGMALKS